MLVNGTLDEEVIYKKSTAMQDWLFGFEIENTIMVFTGQGAVHILTSARDQLEGIESAHAATTVHSLPVGDNSEAFGTLIGILRDNLEGVRTCKHFCACDCVSSFLLFQKGVGALPREAALGEFVEGWKKAFNEANFTVVNIANAIGNLLSTKDEQEQVWVPLLFSVPIMLAYLATTQKYVRTASAISAAVLKNFVVNDIETVIDEEQKITHSELAEKIDEFFTNPSTINPKACDTILELMHFKLTSQSFGLLTSLRPT